MAEQEINALQERITLLENSLKQKGYHYDREEDSFIFYRKATIGAGNYSQEMGFNATRPDSIISYFGVVSKYPISCNSEIEFIQVLIADGFQEQRELNALVFKEILK